MILADLSFVYVIYIYLIIFLCYLYYLIILLFLFTLFSFIFLFLTSSSVWYMLVSFCMKLVRILHYLCDHFSLWLWVLGAVTRYGEQNEFLCNILQLDHTDYQAEISCLQHYHTMPVICLLRKKKRNQPKDMLSTYCLTAKGDLDVHEPLTLPTFNIC